MTPDPSKLPAHVAIIMDGNGRWARQRGKPVKFGHRHGAEVARSVVEACVERSIPFLTLFAFSSENWSRPIAEVDGLMALFLSVLKRSEINQFQQKEVKFNFIGKRDGLAPKLLRSMDEVERLTENNTGTTVTVAVDYGGRWDITEAAIALGRQVEAGQIRSSDIDADLLRAQTSLGLIPDPDLCIRTGERKESVIFCCGSLPTLNSISPTVTGRNLRKLSFNARSKNLPAANAGSGQLSLRAYVMSDDLKQRVVTAVVLLVALIALTLLTTPLAFAAVVAVIIMLAAWEWGAFAQFEGVVPRLFYTLSVFIVLVGAAALSGFWSSAESFTLFRVILILCFGVLWWCIAACLLVGYPENSACWNHKFTISLMGLLALVPTWTGLVALKVVLPSGYLVLGVVIAVAGVDVGAYFAGRYLGNRPLAPSVSPKKTWEGVWGGFATCCAVSAVLVWAAQRDLLELSSAQILVLLLSCITTTPFAVVGDLVESMLKRNSDLKDSGSIRPGHGGVLDRVDGLLAVAPSSVLIFLLALDWAR